MAGRWGLDATWSDQIALYVTSVLAALMVNMLPRRILFPAVCPFAASPIPLPAMEIISPHFIHARIARTLLLIALTLRNSAQKEYLQHKHSNMSGELL